MKKIFTFISLCMIAFNTIHAEITWTLSNDGTLTISGTSMQDYKTAYDYGPGSAPWYNQRLKIKEVVIKNGVTNIGNYAFYECHNLTSVTIPNSVKNIGSKTFFGCSSLTSITIPNSVTSIGGGAFYNCSSLNSVIIPNSVTSIEAGTFEICSGLISVTIPNTVTSIGDCAFQKCSSLTSVTIPNSVKTIGEQAFYGCSSLTSVTIGNSVTSMGGKVFYDCSRLTLITIPNSVTSIGGYAFNNCRGLSSVTISNSIKSITAGTFYGCSGLTSVIIPNSVMDIEYEAFCGCIALASITIPNSVTSVSKSAFARTKWYNIQLDGEIYVGKVLYRYKGTMPSNTQIDIKEGTTQITDNAFANCSNLISITIPNSVTKIGNEAFSYCSGLTSITIPNSVTSIGNRAFSGCSGLTSVTIPNSVTSIGSGAFWGTKWYDNQPDGLIYAGKVLYEYKGTMPSNTKIYIKEGTIEIAGEAFSNCSGLTSITIPNSVTSIGDYAFSSCSALTSITIPNSVTSIGDNAFKVCSALTSITIGNSVTSIGMYAFDGCSSLASLTCEATTPPICIGLSFSDVNKSIPVYVPANSVAQYRGTDEWNEFNDFRGIVSEDQAKANAVIAKINAIGMVEYTDASKNKIDAASKAYNTLTANQKTLVTNLDVLTKAQQTYDNLKAAAEKLAADKAKADVVIAKIITIGEVEYTDVCKSKIDNASKAYNALTDDQKALVTNLEVLTKAQQTYDNLKAAAEKLAADKAVFDKYKSEIMAIIEALAKEDDSDAVKEIIRKAISDIDALEYEDVISLDDNKAKVLSFVTSVNESVENQRVEDQKSNGIEELEFAERSNIYDLNGRKITSSMLKSGLYIRNGKKMVVK